MGGGATRPPRSATRRPELPRATLRKGRAHWLELLLPFRPASRRTAQAGRLCYQTTIFQTRPSIENFVVSGVEAVHSGADDERRNDPFPASVASPEHGRAAVRGNVAGVRPFCGQRTRRRVPFRR